MSIQAKMAVRWTGISMIAFMKTARSVSYTHLKREIGEFTAQIIKMQMKGMEADNYDYFTYVSLYSPVRTVYYRLVFKSYEPVEGLDAIVNSFQRIPAKGLAVYNLSLIHI